MAHEQRGDRAGLRMLMHNHICRGIVLTDAGYRAYSKWH